VTRDKNNWTLSIYQPEYQFTCLPVYLFTGNLTIAILVLKRINIFALPWDFSSVGLEHRLDRAGVVGSNPSNPTVNALKIKGNQ
jgi:hypothetical protein